jgi:hypothetical protein
VPVPSLFFIQNGIPIKVVTSVVKTKDELLEAIENVIKTQTEASGSSAITPTASTEVKKPEPEIVCDGDKCYKKEATASSSNEEDKTEAQAAAEETEEEKQEKVKRAMKLIEEQRIERVKEEQKLEKERELRRRKDGQKIQKLQSWQDEQEMAKLQDERKREKMEATEARQRVLKQIEDDKKERARRFNPNPTDEEPVKKVETAPQATTPTTIPPNSARIQFKKPDGDTEIVTFDSDIPFADLHAFVKSDVLSGTTIKEFTLATAFPRREFSEADFEKTLNDLNLAPSAVVLIIPGKKSTATPPSNPSSVLPTRTGGSVFDMLSTVIMGIFTPVLAFFVYVKNLAFQSRGSGVDETGKRKRDEEVVTTPNDA